MPEIFDVAIVGAGPAGATCAVALARGGVHSVALIDRDGFPRDKVCGDGLGPGAVRVARDLGLDDLFAGYVPVEELSVSGPAGRGVAGPLPPVGGKVPEGYVIPRLEFDNRLFAAARARGVDTLERTTLESAAYDEARAVWSLGLAQGGATRALRCRVLVGADGARSKVRQLLNVPYNAPAHTGAAARIYAAPPHAARAAMQLDFVRELLPAYGWFFPISAQRANAGIAIDIPRFKALGLRLGDLLARYLNGGARQGALPLASESYGAYLLPYGSQLPKLVHGRAALIGDAGSMINPLTGEGIFYGMYAGKILGEQLADAFAAHSPDIEDALSRYEAAFRARFARHFRLNGWMKRQTADPFTCNLVIRACERNRRTLAELIDLMVGDGRRLPASLLFRIVLAGLRP